MEDTRRLLEAKEDKILNLESNIETLTKTLNGTQEELDRLLKDQSDLSDKYQKLKEGCRQMNASESQLNSLKDKVDSQQSEITERVSERDSIARKMADLKREFAEQSERLRGMEGLREELGMKER